MLKVQTSARAGFSLIELMIALTILAIALIPVAYFYSKSLQTVEEASIRTRALMLANERLAELRQMPYDQIRTNVTPSNAQKLLFTSTGDMDLATENWTGSDFEVSGRTTNRGLEWAGMFFYPLPLDFNPYQPTTQGYNNAVGSNHYTPNNPSGGSSDGHINLNDNTGGFLDFEYEPVGFYSQRVRQRNEALTGTDRSDIGMQDRRTLTTVDPSIDLTGNGGSTVDYYRSGVQEEADKYAIFGRRTIILDAQPVLAGITDTDGAAGASDGFAPDDDRDGGATAVDPNPLSKGPDNKFQVVSRYGLGKLVIVQVFWLPRNPAASYIQAKDLSMIELKTFVAPNGDTGSDFDSNVMLRNNLQFITPGT